jgi:hypothetical protein
MLNLIVCSTTLHKRVKNCQVTNDGANSDHRAVQMQLNLTSLKYNEKASLDSGDIDWRKICEKDEQRKLYNKYLLELTLATWPMTLSVKPLYVLAMKQPSPLSANAKDGTKQVNPYSLQPSKKRTNCNIHYKTKETSLSMNSPTSNSSSKSQQTQPRTCQLGQSTLV